MATKTRFALRAALFLFISSLFFGTPGALAAPDPVVTATTTSDRDAGDPIDSADRLSGVTIEIYIEGDLAKVGETKIEGVHPGSVRDEFTTVPVGPAVIICADPDQPGHTFDRIVVDPAKATPDPQGRAWPCVEIVVDDAVAREGEVTASFNYLADLAVKVSTTANRNGELADAERITGVTTEAYINGQLTATTTTTVTGNNNNTDTITTAPIGSTVIICADPTPTGHTFNEITVNPNPVPDPQNRGWPCTQLTANPTNTAVTASFDYLADLAVKVSTTVGRQDNGLFNAERLTGVTIETYINGQLTTTAPTTITGTNTTTTDTFTTAPIGATVTICADPTPTGHTFNEITVNSNPVPDPQNRGWPCTQNTANPTNTAVSASFDYHELTGGTIPLAAPCVIMDSGSAVAGDHFGPYLGDEKREVQATGLLPSDQGASSTSCVPSDATAITVTISVSDVVQAGNLRLSPAGVEATGGVVNFAPNGLDNSNTVTVPVSPTGAFDIFANGGSFGIGDELANVRLVAIAYEDPDLGLDFVPLTPCAVADSRETQNEGGFFIGPFKNQAALPDIDVVETFPGGQGGGNTNCGVPRSAKAVVINVVAINSTGDPGTIAVGAEGSTPIEGPTRFANLGMNNAATTIVPVTSSGLISLNVLGGPSSSTHVRIVVLGYLEEDAGSTFVPVTPCAAFDTRHGSDGFNGLRTGNQTTTFDVAGDLDLDQGGGSTCGIPEGVTSVLMNLVAINPAAAGNFRVSAEGTVATGGVLNFTNLSPAMNNSNAIPVTVSPTGEIDVFTNGGPTGVGADITHVRGVVLGYYTD